MKVRILRKATSRVVLGIAGALWLLFSTNVAQAQEQHVLRAAGNLKVIDANTNLVGFVIAPWGKRGDSGVGSTVAFIVGEDFFLVDLTVENFAGTESGLLFPKTDCIGTVFFATPEQTSESNRALIRGAFAMNDDTVFVADRSGPHPPVAVTHRSAFYSQLCQLFQLEQTPVVVPQAKVLLNLNSLFRPPFRLR